MSADETANGLRVIKVSIPLQAQDEPYNLYCHRLLKHIETLETKEPPLLQCVECKNTESPAGAMARQWNHGRCLYCGGYFKVIRA